jgi:hypothetical protein
MNTLNCQGFSGPIVFSVDVQTNLREIIGSFQGTGPSAQIWMPLLTLAEACNPTGIKAGAAKCHISQYLPCGPGQLSPNALAMYHNNNAAGGSNNALEGVLTNILGALPRVQDTLSKVIASSREEPQNMGKMIDHVQQTLLMPLIDGLGNQENIQPAVSKILDGFRNLSNAMQQTSGGAVQIQPPTTDSLME